MQVTGEPWNDVTSPSLRFTRSCRKKKKTLKIPKKSRFQPNEKIFAESCSVRYKDLLRAKKIFGVIGTLRTVPTNSKVFLPRLMIMQEM